MSVCTVVMNFLAMLSIKCPKARVQDVEKGIVDPEHLAFSNSVHNNPYVTPIQLQLQSVQVDSWGSAISSVPPPPYKLLRRHAYRGDDVDEPCKAKRQLVFVD